MSEEAKTAITIAKHILFVRTYLDRLANTLVMRGLLHDASKTNDDEFDGFVKIGKISRTYPYGSDEYKQSMRDNKDVIDLHYSRNPHHPEHHKNGVADMSLIDIIEMVCDWKAASEVYGKTSFEDSLKISIERFGLTSEQEYLVKLIAKELKKGEPNALHSMSTRASLG